MKNRVEPQSLGLGRRRFLCVVGAATTSACAGLPFGRRAQDELHWQGAALGAQASLTLRGFDEGRARHLVSRCLEEISRLEKIFSLYVPDSSIRALNKRGYLENPPPELVDVIGKASRLSEQTNGRFDISIQPLFHYLFFLGDSEPDEARLTALQSLVNYRGISSSGEGIFFSKPGMQVTLNGLAQGYITDRVTRLLKSEGVQHTLVHMGEYSALGRNHRNEAWRIGIRDPNSGARSSSRAKHPLEVVPLDDSALATSEPLGTLLRERERLGHILDARDGRSTQRYTSISVKSPLALDADLLSTALTLLDRDAQERLLAQYPESSALVYKTDGTRYVLGTVSAFS